MSDKLYKVVNGKKLEIKGAELEALKIEQEQEAERLRLFEAEQQAKEAARQSAMDKLAALGLNEEEVAALIK